MFDKGGALGKMFNGTSTSLTSTSHPLIHVIELRLADSLSIIQPTAPLVEPHRKWAALSTSRAQLGNISMLRGRSEAWSKRTWPKRRNEQEKPVER